MYDVGSKRSNCFFYVAKMAYKHKRATGRFGYITTRGCKYHPFCLHWLWSSDLVTWYNYTIKDSKNLSWLNKLYYKGYVKIGDADDDDDE